MAEMAVPLALGALHSSRDGDRVNLAASPPASPLKLNANYNTAVQRWFKVKQVPVWNKCAAQWRDELGLLGECDAKAEAMGALAEWDKMYNFAMKEKKTRRDKCGMIEAFLALVEIAVRHQLPASSLKPGLYTTEALPTRADYANGAARGKLRLPARLHIHHALQVLTADMRPNGASGALSFDDEGSFLAAGEECGELVRVPRKRRASKSIELVRRTVSAPQMTRPIDALGTSDAAPPTSPLDVASLLASMPLSPCLGFVPDTPPAPLPHADIPLSDRLLAEEAGEAEALRQALLMADSHVAQDDTYEELEEFDWSFLSGGRHSA